MVHCSFSLLLFLLTVLRGWDLTIHTRCPEKAAPSDNRSQPKWLHWFFVDVSMLEPVVLCIVSHPIALVPTWQFPSYTFSSVFFGSKPVR